MASPYFVSVDPSLAKLRMFFGRRREIRTITDYLRNGDSVLLIGERRIGKTFLLYMLGDPTGKGADFYETLLDRKTGILLAELRRTTTSCDWAYVDLLSVTNAAGFCFRVLAELGGEQAAKDFASSELDHADFVTTLRKLSTNLSRQGKRAVVLVDESEKLLKLDQSANLLACLKAAIQQCDSVDFLLAGDIKPQHQAVPEFASLQGALQVHYLAPLDTADAMGLIRAPVEGRLSFDDQVLERILDLTGCKPSLVQVLCGHLYELVASDDTAEIRATLADFDSLWESSLRSKVFESFGGPLRGFFEDLQGHERSVFSFLSRNPLATEDAIVEGLALPPAVVRKSLHNLQVTHRVTQVGSGFRIGARIVEDFGCLFDFPTEADGKELAATVLLEVRADTLEDVISQGESAVLEFKSSLRWHYYRKTAHSDIEEAAVKTIAAFLNTDGGTLVLGVNDDGEVLGLSKDYDTLRKKDRDGFELFLMTLISENLGKDVCRHIHPKFFEIEGLEVCVIQAEASRFPVYSGKDAAFCIRTGNQTQKLNPREAVKYIRYHWSES